MKKKNSLDVFSDSQIKVPFVLPEITSGDKRAILSMLNQNLLTDGPKLREFENKFPPYNELFGFGGYWEPPNLRQDSNL